MDTLRILDDLNVVQRLPVEAIRAAQAERAATVPSFLQCIDELVASGGRRGRPGTAFFAFHLFGEWREKSAYRPLAGLLRLPSHALEPILGDAKTETANRVMAAVFDGDPAPLYEIIRDETADEFIRKRMIDAVSMLTLSGDIPRGETERFLRECYDKLQPQEDCYVWQGWLDAVAWLGFADLKPLAKQAFDRGSIDPTWLSFGDFEQDLQHTIDHPEAGPLHPDGELTLFGETVAELSGWAGFKPKSRSNRRSQAGNPASSAFYDPERNPFRKVGRNDPCPCGSGKKFKKCCYNRDFGM